MGAPLKTCRKCGNSDSALFKRRPQNKTRGGVFWACVICEREYAKLRARDKRSDPEERKKHNAANREYKKRLTQQRGGKYIPQWARTLAAIIKADKRSRLAVKRALKPKRTDEDKKAKARASAKAYYHAHKAKIIRRILANPERKMRVYLRSRIWKVLKRQGAHKSKATEELTGCSSEFLRAWIEGQFKKGMTWQNYGRHWHIDHIIPCIAFDLRDLAQQKRCFHYSNLRPLEAKRNWSKHARIEPSQPELPLVLLRKSPV